MIFPSPRKAFSQPYTSVPPRIVISRRNFYATPPRRLFLFAESGFLQCSVVANVPHRVPKTGCAVAASTICRQWCSSAPTEASRLPQGDHARPATPTVWKPAAVILICFVVAFQTNTWEHGFVCAAKQARFLVSEVVSVTAECRRGRSAYRDGGIGGAWGLVKSSH